LRLLRLQTTLQRQAAIEQHLIETALAQAIGTRSQACRFLQRLCGMLGLLPIGGLRRRRLEIGSRLLTQPLFQPHRGILRSGTQLFGRLLIEAPRRYASRMRW
jgi:hypothetical protein